MPILLFAFPLFASIRTSLRFMLPLFHELERRGYIPLCATTEQTLVDEWGARQWRVSRLPWIALPVLVPWYRVRHHVRVLVCLASVEKLIATPLARLFGMRVIWIEWSLPRTSLFARTTRFLYCMIARLATVVVISDAACEAFVRLGIPRSTIVRIYPGIAENAGWQTSIFTTMAEMKQPTHRRSQFCIGTITELADAHGIEYLLQAIHRCTEVIPDIQCIVVGHGSERQSLQWLIERLDIQQHVTLVGWHDAPQKWIVHFDIVVLPSTKGEAMNMMLLEAMAQEKPLIGTRIGGIPEIIESTKTGMLVEPANAAMLAEAILNLYHHPEWRAEMGKRGRDRARKVFSLDRMADEFEKILTKT